MVIPLMLLISSLSLESLIFPHILLKLDLSHLLASQPLLRLQNSLSDSEQRHEARLLLPENCHPFARETMGRDITTTTSHQIAINLRQSRQPIPPRESCRR